MRVRTALIAFGLACLLFYATVTIRAAVYQHQAKAALDEVVSAHREPIEPLAPAVVPSAGKPIVTGDVIGRVDIPRLKLSAVIAEGDDNATLGKAVGHLPDTPLPWLRRGNVGLAAHRDGLFRELKDIRIGDEVKLVTTRGDFSYRVRKTQIVNPDDVWVLNPTVTPSLTLITCYPFAFIGNAPQRFIVQADLTTDLGGSALKGAVVR